MRLADPRLQKLTNEFIEKFFKMAHDIKIEEGVGKHPATHSTKRDDSFEFNYTLAECIANSDEGIRQAKGKDDFPLIGHGFPSNTIKGFFANAVIGIKEDLAYVIDNFDKQDENLDYFVKHLHKFSAVKTVKNVNVDFIISGKGEKFVMEDEKHDSVEFTVYNNKSGYMGLCKVLYIDGDFHSMELYGRGGKRLGISARQLRINSREEPTVEHFKHVADINGFFMVLEQVKYGIEDVLKGE